MPLSLLLGLFALLREKGRHRARTAPLGMHGCCGLLAFLVHAPARFLDLRLVFRVDRRRGSMALPVARALKVLARSGSLLPRRGRPTGLLLRALATAGALRATVALRAIIASALLSLARGRLRLRRAGRCAPGLEALDRAVLHLAVDEPLDRGHQRAVFVAHERHRIAFDAGAAGAADAVH